MRFLKGVQYDISTFIPPCMDLRKGQDTPRMCSVIHKSGVPSPLRAHSTRFCLFFMFFLGGGSGARAGIQVNKLYLYLLPPCPFPCSLLSGPFTDHDLKLKHCDFKEGRSKPDDLHRRWLVYNCLQSVRQM